MKIYVWPLLPPLRFSLSLVVVGVYVEGGNGAFDSPRVFIEHKECIATG